MAIQINSTTVIDNNKNIVNVANVGSIGVTTYFGNGSNLVFDPKVISFSPAPLSTGVPTTTNIVIIFDQTIQFSGIGTINIRAGSSTGTITTSFTCGVSPRATISGSTLTIDPAEPLGIGETYYVVLPSVGIANTFGTFHKGTSNYLFQTQDLQFSASGGNHVFTLASAPSPTGYYKYHVFTSTGILTTTSSSTVGVALSAMLVGGGGGSDTSPIPTGSPVGGGGAGGLVRHTGPTLALSAGTYTITIGGGGSSATATGTDSTIGPPTGSALITAFGGGRGGEPTPTIGGTTAISGGSGGGGGSTPYGVGLSGGQGASGVSGQGFAGGRGAVLPAPPSPGGYGGGGGGGGSGGAGGAGTWPEGGGFGGSGLPNPQFTSTLIAAYVPTIPASTWASIGSNGRYAGGGGGNRGGSGGPGGGGDGSPVSPATLLNGMANTGGGAGGNTSTGASGGSGVFMIRYAVPAP